MTINELIEKLKEYGDEKARDMGVVRIVNSDGGVVEDQIDVFDVKFGPRGVDIPLTIQNDEEENDPIWEDVMYRDGDEDDYDWDDYDDEEEDGEDEEDYGWGDDDEPKKP